MRLFSSGNRILRVRRCGSSPQHKLVVLVLDADINLRGERLAILGKRFLSDANTLRWPASDADRLALAVKARDENVGWDTGWATRNSHLNTWSVRSLSRRS